MNQKSYTKKLSLFQGYLFKLIGNIESKKIASLPGPDGPEDPDFPHLFDEDSKKKILKDFKKFLGT